MQNENNPQPYAGKSPSELAEILYRRDLDHQTFLRRVRTFKVAAIALAGSDAYSSLDPDERIEVTEDLIEMLEFELSSPQPA